ncbi:MAG: hypothetical protein J6W52_06240 [Bacteroidaceae bacterium]|nr:hypothetical protein [Bacteroidaceae bacterium]
MKKTYIIPATEISHGIVEEMIAASITNIGGDSDLKLGEGDIPDEADVRESENIWDGDW